MTDVAGSRPLPPVAPAMGEGSFAATLRGERRLLRLVASGALLFVIGTALGVFFAWLPFRARVPIGASLRDLFHLPGIGSMTLVACLVSSPLYVWLARRCPIHGPGWWRNLVVHAVITAGLVALTGAIVFRVITASMPQRPPVGDLGGFLLMRLVTESLPFWAMIALLHALEFNRRYRQHEIETAKLQAQLAEARLEALTAQLQPHFLFNTLQGISTLMHRDVEAADAMLSQLGELLRRALQRGDRHEVPLSEELEVLEHYVEIWRARFEDRLVFETRVSASVREALVPVFILQPLVENALHHGIARHAGIGRVTVGAELRSGTVQLSVTDDGPGIPVENALEFPREGIGLSNTRQRLRQLYGDRQSLELELPAAGGLIVKLSFPHRPAIARASEKEIP